MKKLKLKNLVAVALVALTIAIVSPTEASAAWKQDTNGWWNTKGDSYSLGWESINGSWYYFGSDGYMKTGWLKNGSTWYYLDGSGSMKTGWLNNNNSWYYLNAAGAMQTGLVQLNDKTYYLSESGAMKTGNVTINGQNYTFGTTGEKITTTTQATNNITQETDKATTSTGGSSSSGGSGGSGGSSNSKNNESSSSSYKTLYGTWTVENHIPSNINTELNANIINKCIGKEFTISEDKIDAKVMTLSNPNVKESTLTASQFSNEYKDTFKNLGISGDKVKAVHISQKNKSDRSVDVLIADDGKTYALLKGSLFKLEKQ